MPDLPAYPNRDDEEVTPADAPAPRQRRAGLYLLLAAVIAVILVVIILHLTGVVGPGAR